MTSSEALICTVVLRVLALSSLVTTDVSDETAAPIFNEPYTEPNRKDNKVKLVVRNRQKCDKTGFRRGVNKVFALLGCYTMSIGNYRRFGIDYRYRLQVSSWPLKMAPIGCPETSVTDHQLWVTYHKIEDPTKCYPCDEV